MMNTLMLQFIGFIYQKDGKMLATLKHHEFPANALLSVPGAKMWRLVSFEIQMPYFFVSYGIRKDDIWFSEACVLCYSSDLLAMCEEIASSTDMKLKQIALMLPPEHDQRDLWSMVTLKQIWKGKLSPSDHQVVVYFDLDGKRLTHMSYGGDEKVDLVQLVYSFWPLSMQSDVPFSSKR